jgi:hypothetical protein
MKAGTIIFNVQQNRVVCRFEDFFLKTNKIAGFSGLNLFSWVS